MLRLVNGEPGDGAGDGAGRTGRGIGDTSGDGLPAGPTFGHGKNRGRGDTLVAGRGRTRLLGDFTGPRGTEIGSGGGKTGFGRVGPGGTGTGDLGGGVRGTSMRGNGVGVDGDRIGRGNAMRRAGGGRAGSMRGYGSSGPGNGAGDGRGGGAVRRTGRRGRVISGITRNGSGGARRRRGARRTGGFIRGRTRFKISRKIGPY